MGCVPTRTRRFSLLSSLAFLCMVPPSSVTSVEHVPSSDIIKIRSAPFSDIFHALLSEQDAVLASATVLGATSRRRLATDAAIEEAEE